MPSSAVAREAVWVKLFAVLQAALGGESPVCVTISRKHTEPPQLAAEMQPACFLVQVRNTKVQKPIGFPGKLTLTGYIILYFQCPTPLIDPIGEETVLGATTLNTLLDAIDAAMQPDNIVTGKLTLGGLVEHCWIEGQTDMDDGMYSQQGAAMIPVNILVP
jgi:hypothetical protein